MLRDHKQYAMAVVTAETNVAIDPPQVITGAIDTIKVGLVDELGKREIAFRFLTNTGAVDVYYTIGFDKPNQGTKVYHGVIAANGGQVDFSRTDKAVYITSSTGAFEVSPCVGYRT